MRRVGTVYAEVSAPHRRRQLTAQRRMVDRDPLERTLDALRHRETRPLSMGRRLPTAGRRGELIAQEGDVGRGPLDPSEIIGLPRIVELFAQLFEAPSIGRGRLRVE